MYLLALATRLRRPLVADLSADALQVALLRLRERVVVGQEDAFLEEHGYHLQILTSERAIPTVNSCKEPPEGVKTLSGVHLFSPPN